jgi:hypothetical protein
MEKLLKEILLDRTGWIIWSGLCCTFLLGLLVARTAGLFLRGVQYVNGIIAVYAPSRRVRLLAWDAVERLHRWNAVRILMYSTTRSRGDSADAAAWAMSQEVSPDADVVFEKAENDPTLSGKADVLAAARLECRKVNYWHGCAR